MIMTVFTIRKSEEQWGKQKALRGNENQYTLF